MTQFGRSKRNDFVHRCHSTFELRARGGDRGISYEDRPQNARPVGTAGMVA
jgi:hypothetical protein